MDQVISKDIQEIDVDEFPSLAEEAEVRGVPTLMIYDNDHKDIYKS